MRRIVRWARGVEWDMGHVIIVCSIGLVIVLVLAFASAYARDTDFEQACLDAGGHLYSSPGADLCLTDDSRIIEIEYR